MRERRPPADEEQGVEAIPRFDPARLTQLRSDGIEAAEAEGLEAIRPVLGATLVDVVGPALPGRGCREQDVVAVPGQVLQQHLGLRRGQVLGDFQAHDQVERLAQIKGEPDVVVCEGTARDEQGFRIQAGDIDSKDLRDARLQPGLEPGPTATTDIQEVADPQAELNPGEELGGRGGRRALDVPEEELVVWRARLCPGALLPGPRAVEQGAQNRHRCNVSPTNFNCSGEKSCQSRPEYSAWTVWELGTSLRSRSVK